MLFISTGILSVGTTAKAALTIFPRKRQIYKSKLLFSESYIEYSLLYLYYIVCVCTYFQ
jgi:hypothetical protein